MGAQHIGDAAIEAFDHAVGWGLSGRNQAVLDVRSFRVLAVSSACSKGCRAPAHARERKISMRFATLTTSHPAHEGVAKAPLLPRENLPRA